MSKFQALEGGKLRLKPICHKDAQRLFEILSLPDVCIYNDLDPLLSKQEARELIQHDLMNSYEEKGVRYSIFYHNHMIGTCGVSEWHHKNKVAIIGYELDPLFWHQGLMYQALDIMIKYIFSTRCPISTRFIKANTHRENTASIKLLVKLGFVVVEETTEFLTYELTNRNGTTN